MNPCETTDHPAELLEDCTEERPIEYTSNKEYISAHFDGKRRIRATGYGYGHGGSPEEADAMAEERAMEHAAEQLKHKLTIFGSAKRGIFTLARQTLRDFWCKLGGTYVAKPPLVNEIPLIKTSLIAPIGTSDCHPIWEGRIVKKPWQYACTVGIPHLNTPESLAVVIETLRTQTARPYIIVVDTGSDPEVKARLEELRADDVEIHYIAGHGYEHSSEPVAMALDLIQTLCRTEHLFQTHADVFLRRKDFLEDLVALVNEKNPAIGYRMSPRHWATSDWEWMIGHTASMFHMPTLHKYGVTWSMQRMRSQWGVSMVSLGGWPDTETGFNYALKEAGLKARFIGDDINHERYIDRNIDHARSYTGTMVYAQGEIHDRTRIWMADAIQQAKQRNALVNENSGSVLPPVV